MFNYFVTLFCLFYFTAKTAFLLQRQLLAQGFIKIRYKFDVKMRIQWCQLGLLSSPDYTQATLITTLHFTRNQCQLVEIKLICFKFLVFIKKDE